MRRSLYNEPLQLLKDHSLAWRVLQNFARTLVMAPGPLCIQISGLYVVFNSLQLLKHRLIVPNSGLIQTSPKSIRVVCDGRGGRPLPSIRWLAIRRPLLLSLLVLDKLSRGVSAVIITNAITPQGSASIIMMIQYYYHASR